MVNSSACLSDCSIVLSKSMKAEWSRDGRMVCFHKKIGYRLEKEIQFLVIIINILSDV